MRIVDSHTHILDVKNYVENFIKIMELCRIEKACISGLGKLFNCVNNQNIKEIFDTYPDKFFGVYYYRTGVSSIDEIQRAFDDGFVMLKVTIPKKPYYDKYFFPIWQAAQQLSLPILFHTGIVTVAKGGKGDYISSWNIHPMLSRII